MKNFLAEVDLIPAHLQEMGLTRCFVYTGPSMMPTLKPGQLLYVRPAAHDIAVGDVLVFVDAAREGHVVHRVISLVGAGFTTRGDNNNRTDLLPVSPKQVIGRVEMVAKIGQIEPLTNGRRGLLRAQIGWATRRFDNGLRWAFHLPYRWLRQSGIVARIWRPSLTKISLETETGTLVKYVHHGKTVACWWPAQNRLDCQKPYDLVLRPSSLLV
jgi:hypothetical protein